MTVAAIAILAVAFSPYSHSAAAIDFSSQVQPIFQKHCAACHGGEVRKAELDLTTVAGIRRGSESGRIFSEDLSQSRLLEVVVQGEMPPEGEAAPLAPADIQIIRQWILDGAQFGTLTAARNQPADQHEALPILLRACATCHGRQLQEGGLDIRTRSTLLEGGKSGSALIPGNPEESLLVKRIRQAEMPPREKLASHSVKPVDDSELQVVIKWIAAGAPWSEHAADEDPGGTSSVTDEDREFWAFQSPQQPRLPAVAVRPDSSPVENAVDAFIVAQLQDQGLSLSPAADRAVLLRRLYFDLLGLPPGPDEITAFLADESPLAYQQLVERLLASPAYGERWGQYWLDLAGYSDSEGVQHADPIRPHAYRYRDYVIAAWNEDRPYDQFLLQQIAGDELVDYESAPEITPAIYENLVATGFLRMTSDGTFSGITGFLPNRLDVIDDQIQVLSSAVMGLTLRCARCHSHKFDPIPQRDYYRLAAVFKGAMDEFDWLKPLNAAVGQPRYLTHVTTAERQAWTAAEERISVQIQALQQEKEALMSPGTEEPRSQAADDRQRAENEERMQQLDARIQELESARTPEPMIRALWDRGDPSPTYLLRRGDYLQPGQVVSAGVPAVLSQPDDFLPAPPWTGAQKTGTRLALAKWLTRPDHPLTARVLVNRVWKHHFGRGLVEPLDDFGRAGGRPSHPRLLDWLAIRFVDQGWSIKELHRLLLNTAVYKQVSRVTPRHLERDPENIWLARMPLQRMDAETLRDSLIALADRLDHRQFGPASAVEAREDGLVMSVSEKGSWRRSIYVLKRRTEPLTILDNFDRPRMSPNCIGRPTSNVPPQALHLMNNRKIQQLSEIMAQRLKDEVGCAPEAQIDRLFLLALARHPFESERTLALQSLEAFRQQWQAAPSASGDSGASVGPHDVRALANLCHAVMNSAAFLYID